MSLGRRAGRAGPLSLWRILGLLPRRLIGKKVLQGLGGHLRLAITGGAAMNSSVADFFAGIGLKVLQGYGLTETSPVVSVNREGDIRRGSVGPPIEGVEVRLADDQELLVRGRGVMQGYLDNPEATKAAIDHEGLVPYGRSGPHRGRAHLHRWAREGNHRAVQRGKSSARGPRKRPVQ